MKENEGNELVRVTPRKDSKGECRLFTEIHRVLRIHRALQLT